MPFFWWMGSSLWQRQRHLLALSLLVLLLASNASGFSAAGGAAGAAGAAGALVRREAKEPALLEQGDLGGSEVRRSIQTEACVFLKSKFNGNFVTVEETRNVLRQRGGGLRANSTGPGATERLRLTSADGSTMVTSGALVTLCTEISRRCVTIYAGGADQGIIELAPSGFEGTHLIIEKNGGDDVVSNDEVYFKTAAEPKLSLRVLNDGKLFAEGTNEGVRETFTMLGESPGTIDCPILQSTGQTQHASQTATADTDVVTAADVPVGGGEGDAAGSVSETAPTTQISSEGASEGHGEGEGEHPH